MELKWKGTRGQYEAKVGDGGGKVTIRKIVLFGAKGWEVSSNVYNPLVVSDVCDLKPTLAKAKEAAARHVDLALAELESRKPKSEAEKLTEALEQVRHIVLAGGSMNEIERVVNEALGGPTIPDPIKIGDLVTIGGEGEVFRIDHFYEGMNYGHYAALISKDNIRRNVFKNSLVKVAGT